MKRKTSDWLVTAYDENDKPEEVFVIKDRTEHEAEKEATPNVQDASDWTMVKIGDEVKRFIKEFGFSQKQVKDLEGFKGDSCAVSEMAINFGYVWVDKFSKWIKKNHMMYDLRDEKVVEYIREKYC